MNGIATDASLRRLNEYLLFGAEDPSIKPVVHAPIIILKRRTTDTVHRLRSFELWDDVTDDGWGWELFVQCLGSSLHYLTLNTQFDYETYGMLPEHLRDIAISSPQLAEAEVRFGCEDPYWEIARFIELTGKSLTRLHAIVCEDDEEGSRSAMFESLALHGDVIDTLHLNCASGIEGQHLRPLAEPACKPRLRRLGRGGTQTMPEKGFASAKVHPFEEASTSVLGAHKTTLERVDVSGDNNMISSAFAQACLELPQLRSLTVSFSQETSLPLLEILYYKDPETGVRMLDGALQRLL